MNAEALELYRKKSELEAEKEATRSLLFALVFKAKEPNKEEDDESITG